MINNNKTSEARHNSDTAKVYRSGSPVQERIVGVDFNRHRGLQDNSNLTEEE